MEVEGSESEEQDIFAGIEIPVGESESEYETSEQENFETRKTQQKKQQYEIKTKSALQIAQDVDGEETAAKSVMKGNRRHLQKLDEINSSKRKASHSKATGREYKKLKVGRNWMLHSKYRDLINIDIADIVAGNISSDLVLEDSQIGSVFWSSHEKGCFFNALSRLGQDNIRGISQRVVTKSEPEVKEYLHLLRGTFLERRIRATTFDQPDFPAAVEISEECCQQLEQTADAFAALQEKNEIKIEKAKWGNSWLLTPETSHWLNVKRRTQPGIKAIEDVLPAINLFNLDNWLELSANVFMNAGPSENEDNWHNLAEGDEVPAIRATAFEDIHSMTVFITKKLISTTLFCTMSRLRAIHSTKTKAAEVNAEDVRAAIEILRMKHTSEEFWTKSARRNKVQIVNDDETDGEDPQEMSYAEVEEVLSHNRSNSCSRSRSRSLGNVRNFSLSTRDTELNEQSNVDASEHSSISHSPSPTPSEPTSTQTEDQTRLKRVADHEAYIAALEAYTETMDQQASLAEELRLWTVLKQDVPESVLLRVAQVQEEDEELKRPRMKEVERDERYVWREWMDYKAEREDVEGVVGEEEFIKRRGSEGERLVSVENGLSGEYVVDDDNEEDDEEEEEEEEGGEE